MDKSIVLFLKFIPKAEFHDTFRNAMLKVVPQVLEDPRCQAFSLHESPGDRAFYLYEIFENQDAYDHYTAQQFAKEVRQSLKEWLAEPIQVTKLTKIS